MMNKSPQPNGNKPISNHPERSDFFLTKSASLTLQDGAVFSGFVPDWFDSSYTGEVVFNTGMVGYVESITDPSYQDQILILTYPLIGNYGVNVDDSESGNIKIKGLVVNELAMGWSHPKAKQSLLSWLTSQQIPIITGIDTRALTIYLRTKGVMRGTIAAKAKYDDDVAKNMPTIGLPKIYNKGFDKKIILVDCGAKGNILESMKKLPVQIKKVPYNYDYTNEQYDGVLISNGPGDPIDYKETIAITRKAIKADKPIFGICLGSQMLGLAAGAKTYKLKYGHRGQNQPCLDIATNKGVITSQNHGYAIDEKSLPKGWVAMFKNLNDGSVEGIKHVSKPFTAVQFHPEACPGPTDTEYLFERFYKSL